MIDSREYPPEETDHECHYCGEPCNGSFCNRDCKKAYEHDN